MISGAIAGGIGGGFSGYQRADAMGFNPWTGERLPVKYDTPKLLRIKINEHSEIKLNTASSNAQESINEIGRNIKEDWILEKMENSPGLGNGSYKEINGYGLGPNTKFPNPRNDCSLRVARSTGVSDRLTTRNIAQFFGHPDTYNPGRLQVIGWPGHMGVVKNGLLYHMQKTGFQDGRLLSSFNRYMASDSLYPTYYTIIRTR